MAYLKAEFEMKDLGKTKFCLGLQLEHLPEGVCVHQSTYTKRVLEKFNMSKCHPLKTPMVVWSLEADKDPFRSKGDDEEVLGPEVPYLSAIGALMYLANCTRPDIAFEVNLLARYSAAPTRRHWVGVKTILRHLQGTQNLGLWFPKNQFPTMVGYVDAGYMSDPHKPDHRLVLSFSVVEQPFPSGLWNRPWLPHRPTTQRELLCMRLHKNVFGCDEWSITSRSHVVWTSPTPPPLSMKIMWLVLHKCAWVMSRAISRSILLQKLFYPHKLQKSGKINILQAKIFSWNLYLPLASIGAFMELVWGGLEGCRV